MESNNRERRPTHHNLQAAICLHHPTLQRPAVSSNLSHIAHTNEQHQHSQCREITPHDVHAWSQEELAVELQSQADFWKNQMHRLQSRLDAKKRENELYSIIVKRNMYIWDDERRLLAAAEVKERERLN
jgi:hypothetical protein